MRSGADVGREGLSLFQVILEVLDGAEVRAHLPLNSSLYSPCFVHSSVAMLGWEKAPKC